MQPAWSASKNLFNWKENNLVSYNILFIYLVKWTTFRIKYYVHVNCMSKICHFKFDFEKKNQKIRRKYIHSIERKYKWTNECSVSSIMFNIIWIIIVKWCLTYVCKNLQYYMWKTWYEVHICVESIAIIGNVTKNRISN